MKLDVRSVRKMKKKDYMMKRDEWHGIRRISKREIMKEEMKNE